MSTQFLLFGIAGAYLLFQTWIGWRRGLARMAASMGALLASAVCGFAVGQAIFEATSKHLLAGGVALAFLTGVVTFSVVYLGIRIGAALILKKTEHQRFGLVKFGFGLGGAILGLVYGLCFVLAGITAIRALGSMAEGQQLAKRQPQGTGLRGQVAATTIEAKEAIESGSLGKFFTAADPLPPELYRWIEKIAKIGASQEAALRFTEFPEVQTLMEDPKINALLADPEIVKALQSGNYIGLLGNKNILAAANNPELAAKLQKFPLEKALDFALASPTPTPTLRR